ncbi:MAG: flagellar hook-associated protein FlgK [Rhodoferax sp.]|uniref:flagellar hook-associated protein FlgK n=1 Tax=Rhodoferax sp. TaxID=50421 RepID=UPI0026396BCF|nr:flagellar hook-associated protein FlgK [Rhodoferax sp.]MDD5335597.1 flagellar hook-associated protein FlgK [Rhodoferax sp.]
MSFNMFYTGLSGLNVAQAALVTTGHNTANVNTPGYSRQSAQIASAGGIYAPGVGYLGTGAKSTDVTRSYDRFLTTQLNQAQSSSQSLSTEFAQISQIDNLLANQSAGLAPLMQAFFAGVQAVANTPADPAARQQLIGSAQAMTNQFRANSQYLSGLNGNVNDQIAGGIGLINTYAEQIADLNKQIAMVDNADGSQAPNDLLDQRDQLVSDLSKLVGTKVVVQDGGQYSVYIGSGQTLVLGGKASTLKAVASAADPAQTGVALVGASGRAVEMHDNVLVGGSLGGLLQFRNETLRGAQNSLGRIAIALSDTFNAQQKLGVDLNGVMGQDFFSQAAPVLIANGNNKGDLNLTPSFADSGQLTSSDYTLHVEADLSYTLTRLSDKQQIALPAGFPSGSSNSVTFDGLTLSLVGGSASAGDSFLIQPTSAGAREFDVRVSDPSKLAAAAPVVTGKAVKNLGNAQISGGTVDASYLATPLAANLTLTYDSASNTLSGFPPAATVKVTLANGTPAAGSPYAPGSPVGYSAGASISVDGITFNISGKPANGDSFTVGKNSAGLSDGRNALLLAGLQNKKTIGDHASSFNDAYAQLVSTVGNKARQIQISNTAQTSLTTQIRAAQQSVSGVNQDEETANLLMYQQMYQANAKVIQTASTLFDAIMGISR